MKIKINNIGFAFVFSLMLALPIVFADFDGGKTSRGENRVLAAMPSLSDMTRHPADFITSFDAWFSDNIGFRSDMIGLYKHLDRLETQGQYTDGQYTCLIGEEGHHFFAGVTGEMIPKFQGKPILTDPELHALLSGLTDIKDYLDGKNIAFIVMFCTDKETVYPEYYPKSIIRGPNPAQLDAITKRIQECSSIDIFNTRERLVTEKSEYLLYDKDGDPKSNLSHYNEIGAFFAYNELMKHIQFYFPDISSFTIDDVVVTYDDNGIPDVSPKHEKFYKKLPPSFFDNSRLRRRNWTAAYENDDGALPTILVMRDSYAKYAENHYEHDTFLSKWLPNHFRKTILCHFGDIQYLEDCVELYKPNIVVFESVERQLKSFSLAVATRAILEGLNSDLVSYREVERNGRYAKFEVDMKNVGEDAWSELYSIRLGFFVNRSDKYLLRARIANDVMVMPGEIYTFLMEVPLDSIDDKVTIRMARDGVKWFGEFHSLD